nr:zinc finger, CCHC-type [Tanacetum cinerariifolium]
DYLSQKQFSIQEFLQETKITGPNFSDWYRKLRLVLSTEDKKNYLEHPIPAAPIAPPGQQVPPQALAAHAAWVKGQKEVAVLMLLTMDLEIQRNLAHLGAYDMLQELKDMYSKQAKQELLQIVREFHTSKQEEGKGKMSHASNNSPFASKPKTPPPPKKDNPAKDAIATNVGLRGSKKLKPSALTLYVGDGHRAVV